MSLASESFHSLAMFCNCDLRRLVEHSEKWPTRNQFVCGSFRIVLIELHGLFMGTDNIFGLDFKNMGPYFPSSVDLCLKTLVRTCR